MRTEEHHPNGKAHSMDGTTIADIISQNPTLTSSSAAKALDKALDLADETLSDRAAKQLVREIDFGKVLDWDTAERALQYLHALTTFPPLHSVVIQVHPEAAEAILKLVNKKNRTFRNPWREKIVRQIEEGNWVMNGATVVFSKTCVMLDGQHRFESCVEAKSPIITHVVFGLEDNVFDRIDQGNKKTAGDILKMEGFSYENELSAAIRWVMWYDAGATKSHDQSIPHAILKQARGKMRTMDEWVNHAHQVRTAFTQHKFPPSMITALCYMIARHDRSTAENFVSNWLHGNRTGIGRNFEILSQRLITVKRQSGGALNREVAFAMLIQTFNHWHAGVVASPQALAWKKNYLFPKLEFDKTVFLKAREKARMSDSTLKAQQLRVLNLMVSDMQGDAKVRMSNRDIADKAGIHTSQVGEIIRSLIAEHKLQLVKKGGGKGGATVYKIAELSD